MYGHYTVRHFSSSACQLSALSRAEPDSAEVGFGNELHFQIQIEVRLAESHVIAASLCHHQVANPQPVCAAKGPRKCEKAALSRIFCTFMPRFELNLQLTGLFCRTPLFLHMRMSIPLSEQLVC
jgi:hypothetical protein